MNNRGRSNHRLFWLSVEGFCLPKLEYRESGLLYLIKLSKQISFQQILKTNGIQHIYKYLTLHPLNQEITEVLQKFYKKVFFFFLILDGNTVSHVQPMTLGEIV